MRSLCAFLVLALGSASGIISLPQNINNEQKRGTFLKTCAEVKKVIASAKDGEYCLHLFGDTSQSANIYCHDMEGTPVEFLTLHNNKTNFADDPEPGETSGRTIFNKIRFKMTAVGLVVIGKDHTFAKTSRGQDKNYGVASDCLDDYSTAGSMKIDLTGTNFYVEPTVEWVKKGTKPGMANLQRSSNNQVVSVNCGGFCGSCEPFPDLILMYDDSLATPCA